jgi:SH3 domain-containing YSC84-like protein 1
MGSSMKRIVFIVCCLIGISARAGDSYHLVNNAELTVRGFLEGKHSIDVRNLWWKAKAIIIVPSYYRAGFMLGGAGGTGVLVAKTGEGLSAPAFVSLGSIGLGFQLGASASEIVVFVMSHQGLESIIANSASFGGQAGLSVATWGGGASGGLNLHADFITMARSVGFYAGVSLEGSNIKGNIDMAQDFYGAPLTVRAILDGAQYRDAANPLLRTLTYYGNPAPSELR